jgi:hypothetical protein
MENKYVLVQFLKSVPFGSWGNYAIDVQLQKHATTYTPEAWPPKFSCGTE